MMVFVFVFVVVAVVVDVVGTRPLLASAAVAAVIVVVSPPAEEAPPRPTVQDDSIVVAVDADVRCRRPRRRHPSVLGEPLIVSGPHLFHPRGVSVIGVQFDQKDVVSALGPGRFHIPVSHRPSVDGIPGEIHVGAVGRDGAPDPYDVPTTAAVVVPPRRYRRRHELPPPQYSHGPQIDLDEKGALGPGRFHRIDHPDGGG
mmetsp:Transcript_19280/g.56230  ORF Transcript_19280/g.56230 Transcript_19280/m.56230 type:complete len:200 (+) Transcript_19280:205-804(+)